MGARLNFGMEVSMGVHNAGIRSRFLEWISRQIPIHHPYDTETDPYLIPPDHDSPFDRSVCDAYRVGDLIVAVSSGRPDMLWIHVYPNVPMQEAWKDVPEFLKKLGVTYADDVQEWYLRKVIGFCDEMIALQGSRR